MFPTISETFIVNKVIYLLNLGYDVKIFTLKESFDWDFFPDLSSDISDIKHRVSVGLSINSFEELLKTGLKRLVFEFLSDPYITCKFLIHNLIFSDNHFLNINEKIFTRINLNRVHLDILSIEFDTLGHKVIDLKPFLKCKVLVNIRGVAQATNTYQKNPEILAYLNKFADMFCFASKFLKRNSFELGLDKSIESTVIYSGINSLFDKKQIKDPSAIKNRRFKVISVGRLAWSKGYEFALEAISIVKRFGIKVEYTIVGDGPYKAAVYYAAKQFDLVNDKTVVFKGSLQSDQVRNELSKADVFLQASVTEGFGVSLLEAQSMGLPAVVTNTGGLPENIVNFRTGFIAQSRNPKDLANKIIYLYNNKHTLRTMGKNAMERIQKYFTLNTEMNHLIKIYNKL